MLLLTLLIGLAHAGPCDDAAEAVDRARIEADLLALAGAVPVDGEPIRSRHVEHPDHDRAQSWLADAMEAAGLETTFEPFDPVETPPVANIVGDLAGAGATVYVTAHFDSTGHAEEGWDPATDDAPGADDDASGIAALLEVARVLGDHLPGYAHRLRFVAFDAEEEGLLGSWHHAEGITTDDVAVVLNMDPVGFNAGGANLLWVTFDERSEAEAEAFADAGESIGTFLDITTLNAALIGGDERSDHFPFWEAGIPALHLASFPQPPEYHTPDDRPDLVDFDFLAAVTSLVAYRACEAADPLPEPEVGGAACTGCAASPGVSLLALLVVARRRRGE